MLGPPKAISQPGMQWTMRAEIGLGTDGLAETTKKAEDEDVDGK